MTGQPPGARPPQQPADGPLGAILHRGQFKPASVARAVEYRAITPPEWDGTARLPLLLVLHGAHSSAGILDAQVVIYQELWSAGVFPEAIVACATTPTLGGFYINAGPGARWESLVADDFPLFLANRFNTDPRGILLLGASMGGYGALKIAFSDPSRFTAVAVLEPTVFPGEGPADAGPRNTLGVLKDLHAAMAGGTGDRDAYARNHVIARLRRNASAILRNDLAIMLECGDNDCFNLHDGAEYLHRALWDLDVSHDYHLIRGADHVGPQRAARERHARAFLASALASRRPAASTPRDAVAAVRAWLDAGTTGPMPAVDYDSAEGPEVLRLLLGPERQAASARDPDTARRYGMVTTEPGRS